MVKIKVTIGTAISIMTNIALINPLGTEKTENLSANILAILVSRANKSEIP